MDVVLEFLTGVWPLVGVGSALVLGLLALGILLFQEGRYGEGAACIGMVLMIVGVAAVIYLSCPCRPGWENWFPVLEGLSWAGVVAIGVSVGLGVAFLMSLSRE